ncbi:hypothetical protein QBC39DRAFT_410083 [Podospora conica]|nr:hypothetical protein QBC39DRAFT_410083 [Schizothecium conicum]
MDPASGVIAFVGFAASLITLAQVLIKGCKTLSQVKLILEDAPDDVNRLHRAMQRMQLVIVKVQMSEEDLRELWPNSDLADLWAEHAHDVQRDVSALSDRLSKIEDALAKKSLTSKNVRARIRKLFMEQELVKYEHILADHQNTFVLFLNMITEMRTGSIQQQIGQLSHSAIHIHIEANEYNQSWVSHMAGDKLLNYEITRQLQHTSAESEGQWNTKQFLRTTLQHDDARLSIKPLREEDETPDIPPGSRQGARQTNRAKTTPRRWTAKRYLVLCQIFSVELPLATLSGRMVRKAASKHDGERSAPSAHSWQFDVALYPLPSLTNTVLQLRLGSTERDGFTFQLRSRSFNASPELKAALDTGDLQSLLNLFGTGRVHPQDLIAPYGNTLLHEAVIRLAIGVPNMKDICNALLDLGVSPNQQNSKGRTGFLQCCRFMMESSKLSSTMRPVVSRMLRSGAELSLSDEFGSSACTLLFQSQHGLQYLEAEVYQFFGLDIYDDLQNADYWLISTLARCVPKFKHHLEAQLREYRTPRAISSDMRPRHETLTQLDAQQQVSWLREAKKSDRMTFLCTICAHGSMAMLEPFLRCGVDLDETPDLYSEKIYMRHAARTGNLDVVQALERAGAPVDQDELYSEPWALVTSAVDELIERWHALRTSRPGFGWESKSPESEYWILEPLLANPTFKGYNTLFGALWLDTPSIIFEQLLRFGCGRRDGQPPRSHYQRMLGSDVIEAVKLSSPHLAAMLDAGLALECEDRLGCTALLHALDLGCADSVELLIKAGANLTRTTGYGITPLQFAETNLKASHPRPLQRAWINKFEWRNRHRRSVTLEEDRRTHQMLRKAIQEDRGQLPLCTLSFRSPGLQTHR